MVTGPMWLEGTSLLGLIERSKRLLMPGRGFPRRPGTGLLRRYWLHSSAFPESEGESHRHSRRRARLRVEIELSAGIGRRDHRCALRATWSSLAPPRLILESGAG